MEKLIFDLQRFGVLDLTGTSVSLSTASERVSTVYVDATNNKVGTRAVDGAAMNLNTTVATGSDVTFSTSSIRSIAIDTQINGGIEIGNVGNYTIADDADDGTELTFKAGEKTANTGTATLTKGTVSGGVLTKFEGLDVADGGTFTFDAGASGTVLGSDSASFTLSNFKGELDGSQSVTKFTSGTITLSNSLSTSDGVTKISGVVAVGGQYTKGKLGDGTEYVNASLGGSSKEFDLTGATEAFNVIGTRGIDTITVGSGNNHSVKAGNGGDVITLKQTDKAVYIMGEGGNDKITTEDFTGSGSSIYGGAGNDTVDLGAVGANGAKELLVNGEDGNDEITLDANVAYSSILGGAGKDTITSKNATNTVTGGADADSFVMGADVAANISDYVYGTDVFSLTGDVNAVEVADAAINTEGALKSDGTSGFAKINDGDATITGSNGFFGVNLVDNKGGKVDLGWVGDSKTTVNGGAVGRKIMLTGATNAEGDLLIGGTKSDTLYAGADDSVYGGAGNDNIIVSDNAGVYVGIATNSGKDTVTDFKGGFDISENDAVYVVNGNASDLGAKVDSDGTVTVTDGTASLALGDLGTGHNQDTNAYELLIGTSKVAVAKSGDIIKTDDLSYADFWIGTYDSTTKTGSGVDLSDVAGVVNVNLDALTNVRNMTTVTGGSGVTSLIGSSDAESLVAATGSTTSLYGGAGNDTLVSSSDTKTEFFFMNGSGKDTIQGFLTGETADVVNFFGSGLGSIVRSDASNVVVTTSDGSKLTIGQATSSDDAKINWVNGAASGVAKIASSVGGTLSYESDVTQYIGASRKDTLTVATTDGSAVNMWLDGSQGVAYSDIDIIDASGNTGNTTIAGSAIAETITGGTGNASLWGGNGKDADVLNATSGSTTMFFYGQNQGNDVINGSANDMVNLYGLNLADVKSANIENSRVVFTTTANDTVTVNGVQTFQLADGTKWKADYTTNQWTQEA